jgi:hypothetical protein
VAAAAAVVDVVLRIGARGARTSWRAAVGQEGGAAALIGAISAITLNTNGVFWVSIVVADVPASTAVKGISHEVGATIPARIGFVRTRFAIEA